jgi:hypothetical protein
MKTSQIVEVFDSVWCGDDFPANRKCASSSVCVDAVLSPGLRPCWPRETIKAYGPEPVEPQQRAQPLALAAIRWKVKGEHVPHVVPSILRVLYETSFDAGDNPALGSRGRIRGLSDRPIARQRSLMDHSGQMAFQIAGGQADGLGEPDQLRGGQGAVGQHQDSENCCSGMRLHFMIAYCSIPAAICNYEIQFII